MVCRQYNRKKYKRGLCLAVLLCLWQASAAWCQAGVNEEVRSAPENMIREQALYLKEPVMPVADVLADTKAHMLSLDSDPGFGSQWFALGLARGGMDLGEPYFHTFYENMAIHIKEQGGVLHRAKYSEYSKAVLALTSVGIDARDVNGYNLLSYLADFTNVVRQGFNGPIWALAALNSHPEYTIPEVEGVGKQTTEQVLVDFLVDGEVSGGGWTLIGDRADVDMTAMTIQALAPYYGREGCENVTAAIDRGVDWLGSVQDPLTGGFRSMGARNSESCAQVVVALCSIGIDPGGDARFVKEGNWPIADLISYHIPGSGFMHVKAGEGNNGGAAAGSVDGMATEQGYYALAAYERFLEGKTPLYDMSDVEIQEGCAVDVPVSSPQPSPTKKPAGSGTGAPAGERTANPTVSAGSGAAQAPAAAPTPGLSATAPAARPAGSTPAVQAVSGNTKDLETGSKEKKGNNPGETAEGEGWNFEAEAFHEEENWNSDAVVPAAAEEPALPEESPQGENPQGENPWYTLGSAVAGGLMGAVVLEGAVCLLRVIRKKGK